MTQPAVPDSADWQRQWTIDAGDVLLQPVTRCMAEDVLAGGPITRTFETGALHDRIPQAMGVAILHIDSGAAAVLPTVWLVTRRADGQILGDIGTTAHPIARAASRSVTALPHPRAGRASVPPPLPPWSDT